MKESTGENPKAAHLLFLSNEGLGTTIIESQVLSVARLARRAGYRVTVAVIALDAYRLEQALTSRRELEKNYGVPIHVLRGVKQRRPGSVMGNRRVFRHFLRELDEAPQVVWARTEYSTAVAIGSRAAAAYRVVWDCRGDTLAEARFRWRRRSALYLPLRWAAELRVARWLRLARTADGALFVSRALRELEVARGYRGPAVVVPNFADPELFAYSSAQRDEARAALRIPRDAPVFAYVGSLAPWQGFPGMVAALEAVFRRDAAAMGIIVCDDREGAAARIPAAVHGRLRFVSGRLADVPRYLNAADFAFLLKLPGDVTRVASPVKFAEYAMCGLRIVHNASVEQASEYAERLGISIAVDDLVHGTGALEPLGRGARESAAAAARKALSSDRTGALIDELLEQLDVPPAEAAGR